MYTEAIPDAQPLKPSAVEETRWEVLEEALPRGTVPPSPPFNICLNCILDFLWQQVSLGRVGQVFRVACLLARMGGGIGKFAAQGGRSMLQPLGPLPSLGIAFPQASIAIAQPKPAHKGQEEKAEP